MRVLVTGPGGFVGRALVLRLSDEGLDVRGAGRAETGGIGPETDWRPWLDGVDAVIHLAARVHVMGRDAPPPEEDYDWVNAEGTRKLAEDAAAAGVRRLVFLSSAKVMGAASPPGRPFAETDPPDPASGDRYAQSKRKAEIHLAEIADAQGIEVAILRSPVVYGPGVAGNIARLARWVERGVPLPFASVDNRRSLVSLANLVDAVHRMLVHPNAPGLTAFVSDGQDLSTPALIGALADALGRPARLVAVPPRLLAVAAAASGRRDLAERLLSDFAVTPTGLAARLDWQPIETPQAGLAAFARWWRDR